jgi:PAS domain S-box-containing protein
MEYIAIEDKIKLKKKNNINFYFVILAVVFFSSIIYKNTAYYYMAIQGIYVIMSWAMFVIVINTYKFSNDKFSLILAIGFLVSGIMEGIYTFTYMDPIKNINNAADLKTIFLAISRLVPGFALYYSFKFLNKKEYKLIYAILNLIFLIITLGIISVYLYFNYFFDESILTTIKSVSSVLILVSILLYGKTFVNKNMLSENVYKNLKHSIFTLFLYSIVTLISTDWYLPIMISVLLKSLYIYYIYKLIVSVSVTNPYKKIKQINDELLTKTYKLKKNNEILLNENITIQQLQIDLAQKESKLNSMLNSSINGIIAIDKNKRVIYINNSLKNILNVKKEGKLLDVIKDYTTNYSDFEKSIEFMITCSDVKTNILYTKDNKTYKCIYAPLTVDSKEEGVVCIWINITTRKEFEKNIVEANEKHENFLQNIGDGIAVLEEGRVVYANDSCKKIFKDELYNIKFENINDEDKEYEFNIDSQKVYVQISFSDFYEDNTKKTIAVIRDITNRKLAQLKLQNSKRSYNSLINILPDGICLLDKDLNIHYLNKSMSNMLEIDYYKKVINKNIKKFLKINFEDENIFNEKLKEVFIKKHHVLLLEHEIISVKGNHVYVELIALPFDVDNEKHIMLIAKDLTYKKNTEEAEHELMERLKVDKVKTEFFANMSHELKTPLNVIYSCNQLLESFYESNKIHDYNDNIKNHIELVRQNSYRLNRLINNIIDLTKMESGFYKIRTKNKDIVSLIEDLFMAVDKYAKRKDINLIFDTEIEEKIIEIDKGEIERIILNLLSNCLKFTNKGGSIYVNIYDKNNHIEISIRDTGMGIPKDKLDFIFEEFGQVDKTLSRNAEGSGIGLSIVRHLLNLHDGHIRVNSEIGVGTEFIITLPVNVLDNNDYNDFEIEGNNIEEKIKVEFSDVYY